MTRPIHVGAIVMHQQRVLFVRQTASHSLGPIWTIPWGVLDPGESPSKGALREALEEAGVRAEVVGLGAVQSLPEPWRGTLALVFLCRHVSGTPTPDGRETSDACYLGAAEILEAGTNFEPWSLWLVRRVLAGATAVLAESPENPFGPDGFIAMPPGSPTNLD